MVLVAPARIYAADCCRTSARGRGRLPARAPAPRRSRADPGRVVLRDVQRLELFPGSDGCRARAPFFRGDKLGDEVDIAAVRDPLEPPHPVEGNVLTDQVTVRRVLAFRHLVFAPAVEAIP